MLYFALFLVSHDQVIRSHCVLFDLFLVPAYSYDDGFDDCIPGRTSHPEEANLKQLKFQHLAKIANKNEHWVTLMPPRNPNSSPSKVSQMPITPYIPIYNEDHTKNNYNIDKLVETCRLISLINDDYDGEATQILEDNLENDTFVYGEGGCE